VQCHSYLIILSKCFSLSVRGGLLVAPILQKLILNRNPVEVLDFADKVAQWDIERIIPAHLKVSRKILCLSVTLFNFMSLRMKCIFY